MLLVFAALFLAGCQSGEQSATGGEAAAPEPVPTQTFTGRAAFQRIFVSARGWAPDAQPYRLVSVPTSDANGQDGSAAVWRGSFASASRRAMRTFVLSGSQAEGAPDRGISPGVEDSYNPNNRATRVFDLGFLKIDSERALEIAQERGGEKILQQNPEQPITYTLEMDSGNNTLTWYVMYGTSPVTSKLRVAINAMTGGFLRIEK